MSLNRTGDFIWLFGAMILVGSALIARRRLPRGRMWAMALAWVAIFALLFAVAHRMDRARETPPPPAVTSV